MQKRQKGEEMLELIHVSKTFNPGTPNARPALRDVNLHVKKGDFISIIGAIGRSNERRKLEQRAARLRNSSSLNLKGSKGDKSKLRIR